MGLPTVSIVVPVRNRKDLLKACLDSMRRLDYPQELLEIVVGDGGSTDGSAELARSYGATVVENPTKDVCGGRNVTFAASKGEVIAFCDSDSEAPRDWLRNALKYLEQPGVAGVGGPEMTPNTGVLSQAVHCCFTLPSYFSVHSHSGREVAVRSVRHVPTCNFVCKRSALESVMPLHWNRGCGSDLELGRRLLERGHTLLRAPDVKMWHHKHRSWTGFLKQLYHYGKGRARLSKEGIPVRGAHAAAASFVPAAIVCMALWIAFEPARPWLQLPLLAALLTAAWLAFVETRKPSVAACTPLLLLAGTVCWSAGFLRGWLAPEYGMAREQATGREGFETGNSVGR